VKLCVSSYSFCYTEEPQMNQRGLRSRITCYYQRVEFHRVYYIYTSLKYYKNKFLMALFEAKNVTKQYGNQLALDNVSLSVPEQSITASWVRMAPVKLLSSGS